MLRTNLAACAFKAGTSEIASTRPYRRRQLSLWTGRAGVTASQSDNGDKLFLRALDCIELGAPVLYRQHRLFDGR